TWGDEQLRIRAEATSGVADFLDVARSLNSLGPALGTSSWSVLSAMASLGSVDLSLARVVEPHIDAQAILHQARGVAHVRVDPDDRQTWGVYAAHPPGTHVDAIPSDGDEREPWTVSGTKHWCSLADQVSHALMTAKTPEGHQQLFALDLRGDGVTVEMSDWKALGLRAVTTGSMRLENAAAFPVGAPGWYLNRPGFAWGGIVVASIWFGAAAALAGQVWAAARRRTPDQIALMHVGACETALETALGSLRAAAVSMDDPDTTVTEAAIVAARTRAIVAHVAEQVMTIVGHALGPAPLAFNEAHATRIADLTLYIRQHHAERDLAHLGALVLDAAEGTGT
ncbi:MAG: acyl-CoA dehydrogenase family protein, partial [Arachnia sp.]